MKIFAFQPRFSASLFSLAFQPRFSASLFSLAFLTFSAFGQTDDRDLVEKERSKYACWITDSKDQKAWVNLYKTEADHVLLFNKFDPAIKIKEPISGLNSIIIKRRGLDWKGFVGGAAVGVGIWAAVPKRKTPPLTGAEILERRFKFGALSVGLGIIGSVVSNQLTKKTFVFRGNQADYEKQREKIKKYTLTGN